MDTDDLDPPKAQLQPANLESLSIAELTGYIARLEAEIGRARAMISAKENVRNGAEMLFKR